MLIWETNDFFISVSSHENLIFLIYPETVGSFFVVVVQMIQNAQGTLDIRVRDSWGHSDHFYKSPLQRHVGFTKGEFLHVIK